MSEYDPQQPDNLSNLLGAYVNTYWNDYLAYWDLYEHRTDGQLSEEQRAIHQDLDKIGDAIRKTIHSLAPDPAAVEAVNHLFATLGRERAPGSDTVANALRVLHNVPLVRDCVSIHLAFEVADLMLPTAERRAADLVALITARRLSDRALFYLDRATRLHLWGFDPECVMMCRSVLEAALAARLAEDLVLDEPTPPLERLITLAGERSVLPGYRTAKNRRGWRADNGSLLWDADQIRWVANRLIHDIPQLAEGPQGVIDSAAAVRTLARVLDHLFPAE